MARRMNGLGVILGWSGLALAMSLAVPASAHISLEQAGTHKSRYGDGELKDGSCGRKNGLRGTNVYTYAPGQKITISVLETIVHPGYFRIAFDDDGDDAFIEPASIKPVDPNRKCPTGPGDHCGMSDFYNSPAVLPGMDNLNPHITAAAGARYTWEVTLPNVECTNCTLQLIQVMEDDLLHGPYDPTPDVGLEDIYHQCIDIVLKRSADGGTGGTSDAATTDIRTPPADSGGGSAGAGGGSGDAGRSDSGAAGARDSGSTGVDTTTPPTGTGGTSGGGGGTGGGSGTGSGGAGVGGTGSGASGGTGSGATGGTGAGGRAGSGAGGSAGGSAGTTGGRPPDPGSEGCSCTVVGAQTSAAGLAAWSLLGLALASRRRRR